MLHSEKMLIASAKTPKREGKSRHQLFGPTAQLLVIRVGLIYLGVMPLPLGDGCEI